MGNGCKEAREHANKSLTGFDKVSLHLEIRQLKAKLEAAEADNTRLQNMFSSDMCGYCDFMNEKLNEYIDKTVTAEAENTRLREQIAIADEYLCSIALHHPYLVPNEKIGDNEYRLTIYDTENDI